MTLDAATVRDARILIIGATGFIGSNLARRLVAAGASVVGASRTAGTASSATQPDSPTLNWVSCDAGDRAQVADVIRRVRPDVIYHLTSDSQGGQDLALIADSLRNDVFATVNVLVEAVLAGGIHVIVTGSLEEPVGANPVPVSPYAAAKWAVCGYARMISALHALPVTVLRPMMVYGPGQKPYKVIPYVIQTLHAGNPARVSSGQRLLDWVYIDDAVDAFVQAGARPWVDTASIDIGSGQVYRLRDLLTSIGNLMGRGDLLVFGGVENRVMEREAVADTALAAERLHWRATTSLTDGLKRTIRAYGGEGAVVT